MSTTTAATTTAETAQPGVMYRFSFSDFAIGEEDDVAETQIEGGKMMRLAVQKFRHYIW